MTTTNHLEDKTKDLAKTIAKKESLMMLGIRELSNTFSGGSKKTDKKNSDEHQITEKTEQYEKDRSNQRPPVILN